LAAALCGLASRSAADPPSIRRRSAVMGVNFLSQLKARPALRRAGEDEPFT
jgi:hypothetical protein